MASVLAQLPRKLRGLLAELRIGDEAVQGYTQQMLELIARSSVDPGFAADAELQKLADTLAEHTNEEDPAGIQAMLMALVL